jgi:hypothetical protein
MSGGACEAYQGHHIRESRVLDEEVTHPVHLGDGWQGYQAARIRGTWCDPRGIRTQAFSRGNDLTSTFEDRKLELEIRDTREESRPYVLWNGCHVNNVHA